MTDGKWQAYQFSKISMGAFKIIVYHLHIIYIEKVGQSCSLFKDAVFNCPKDGENVSTRKEAGRSRSFIRSFTRWRGKDRCVICVRTSKCTLHRERGEEEEMREQDKLLIELVANVQIVERPNRCACCDSIYPKYPCDSLLILLVMFWVL